MYGRYGSDQLNLFLLIACLLCWVLCRFVKVSIVAQLLSVVGSVLILYSLYRTFSRNVPKRYAENQKFTQFFARIKGRKNYCYFKCPSCKTQFKVPKGKGTIRITCPSCKEKFVKKT